MTGFKNMVLVCLGSVGADLAPTATSVWHYRLPWLGLIPDETVESRRVTGCLAETDGPSWGVDGGEKHVVTSVDGRVGVGCRQELQKPTDEGSLCLNKGTGQESWCFCLMRATYRLQ